MALALFRGILFVPGLFLLASQFASNSFGERPLQDKNGEGELLEAEASNDAHADASKAKMKTSSNQTVNASLLAKVRRNASRHAAHHRASHEHVPRKASMMARRKAHSVRPPVHAAPMATPDSGRIELHGSGGSSSPPAYSPAVASAPRPSYRGAKPPVVVQAANSAAAFAVPPRQAAAPVQQQYRQQPQPQQQQPQQPAPAELPVQKATPNARPKLFDLFNAFSGGSDYVGESKFISYFKSPDQGESVFRAMDKDQDHRLSRAEFRDRSFRLFDAMESGISESDWTQVLKLPKAFHNVDTDGSGSVNRHEFFQAAATKDSKPAK